jgi:hypothetical protein
MADNRYNISELFQTAFGVNNPVYLTVPVDGKKDNGIVYNTGIKKVELPEAKRLSKLGTPIVFPVKFVGGNYKFYDSKAKIITKSLNDFWLPPATMVDFSQAKVITKTDVYGPHGSVKEIYSFDDWIIRIRTLCISDEMSAREYEKAIIEWSRAVQSISIEGDLFGWKDIHNITIEEIDIKSLEGSPNVIPIELSCTSDEPFELIYKV